MLEQLLGIIQQSSQQAVVQNPNVPNDQNNDVIQTLFSSITGGLQQNVQSGNIQGLMGLFSGQAGTGNNLMSNPIVSSMANNAINSMMQKLGFSNTAAAGIVSAVLPSVIGAVIGKVNSSGQQGGGLDLNGLLGGLMGGGHAGGTGNLISDVMADGKLDMNDLFRVGSSLLGGNNAAPSQKQEGLDVGSILGGLFGKK
jgi:hypothetical protein